MIQNYIKEIEELRYVWGTDMIFFVVLRAHSNMHR